MTLSSQSVFTKANNYQIDTFITHFEISSSDVPNVARYQVLLTQASRTTDEDNEFNNLQSVVLRNKIITAEDFNYFQNVLINLETNFSTIYADFQAYVDTQKATFNAILQQFTNKGLYNSATTYQQWNTVVYNNQTYMSLQNNSLNHTPSGSTDSWWQLMAMQGAQGSAGLGLVYVGTYSNSVNYTVGQAVNYNGSIYYCIQASIGNVPTNTTYWSPFQFNVAPIIQPTQPSNIANGQIWIQTNI